MDVFEAIKKRRSIRKFKSDEVSKENLTEILNAGRLAPSGSNSQPWKFLVIQESETRIKLSEAAANQKFIAEAPVTIVVLGDRKIFKKRLRRGKELVDIGAVDGDILAEAAPLYKKREEIPGSEERAIFTNCAIAIDHMTLAAVSLGLSSCWVMLMDSDKVSDILGLDKNVFPVALLPLGYADQNPDPRPRYTMEEVAFSENINTPWTVLRSNAWSHSTQKIR
ncbi:MAG: nitroreductase family protein [Planctomycetota bacterium]